MTVEQLIQLAKELNIAIIEDGEIIEEGSIFEIQDTLECYVYKMEIAEAGDFDSELSTCIIYI